jgi:penicillin amidase
MKVFKFSLSLITTLLLIYLLDNSWQLGANRLPPLGKFLDPFEGFWQNIEGENSHTSGALSIPGLKDSVTIVFDSLSIPHIFATNDADLYVAQGYVTAMHRLWQMEFQTHAAAGRISEIISSKDVLNYDRGQRRLGLTFGAEQALQAIEKDPTTQMIAQAYTEGINRYIESLEYKTFPFEYKLLDYEPEAWTPLKCALMLKSMAQVLNMGDKDIEMTNALKLFGKETVDLLYPDREAVDNPVVDRTGEWKFKPITLDTVPLALPQELIMVSRLPPSDPNNGSNNWAVSGSKTATGSPILCGDPHLNLTLPSIWYAIQLHAPGINSMGVSLPGAPGVIIGFNDSIAWSLTNAQRDLVDWYRISFQDSSQSHYLLDGQWKETKKIVESFKVRDAEVFYDTVLYTTWGPIPYDDRYHAGSALHPYAFRWIAHDPSNEMLAFYKLNRATNHDGYTEALVHYEAPAQNFVFASVSGDIAMRVQGKYPVRRKEEGKFVLDGSKSNQGWLAFIPNEQNVSDKNPARGFVSSANQFPVDASYPYYVTARSFEAYRNRRINKVLGESSAITVSGMMNLQNDNYNLKAEESLPVFLSHLDSSTFSSEEKRAFQLLRSWNYTNDKDSEAASYYEAWWDNLMPLIWDEMEKEGTQLIRPTTFTTINLIKNEPHLSFFDFQGSTEKETAAEIIQKAFSAGVVDIEKWKLKRAEVAGEASERLSVAPRWADYKDTYIRHLLRIEPLNIHVQAGGNHDIVNALSQINGPSWRMVVSLEKSGVKSWGVYPGGQSGNAGSRHYADMLGRWTNGQYFPLLFLHSPDDAAKQSFYTINFKPSDK